MTKFLNESGFRRIIKIIKNALAGKQDKKLVVTVTGIGGDNITADKTYNEILAAYNSGADVLVVNSSGYFYHLIAFDSGWFVFMMKPYDETNADCYLLVSPQNVWTSWTWVAQEKLTSGTNIKTINNTSLLGSGNMDLSPYTEYANENELLADTTQRNGTIGFEYSTHKFFIYHATFQEWLMLAQGRAASNTFFEYAFDLVFTQ